MNFKNQNYLPKIIFLFLVLLPAISFADPFDDGPEPPPAPIDNNVYLLVLAGVLFVFLIFYFRIFKANKSTIL